MDAGNRVKIDRFQRIQGAKLLIESKYYPLYKGVNLIGRNKSAAVNIKNVNVSQNQAIIILIDENQHFISDFNSSNGTYLHNTELTPFKLYDLTDNAEVKFGNISGKYLKINMDGNTTIDLHETTEMTQNMTQTFYGANTQLITTLDCSNNEHSYFNETRTTNIHELATQKMDYPDKIPLQNTSTFIKPVPLQNISFHNAPTQLIVRDKDGGDKNSKSSSGSETTQILQFEENCIIENVDTNLHDAATQIVDFPVRLQENSGSSTCTSQETIITENIPTDLNILTSQKNTLHYSQEPSTSGLNKIFDDSFPSDVGDISKNEIIEDTVVDDTVRESLDNANSNDSLDFLEMGNKEQNNKTQENILNKSSKDFHESEKGLLEFTKNDKIPAKCPSSDSDTDIEEPAGKSIDQRQNDEDSDTDIDEAVTKSKKNTKISNSSQSSDITPNKKKQVVKLSESENEASEDLKSGDSDTDLDELAVKTIAKLQEQNKFSSSSQDTDIGPKRKKAVRLSSDSSENNVEMEISKFSDHQAKDDSDTELDELMVTSIAKFKEQDISSSSQDSNIIRPKRKTASKLPDTQSDEQTDVVEEIIDSNIEKVKEISFNESDIIPSTQADTFEQLAVKDGNQSSEESFKLGITELLDDLNSQTQTEDKMTDANRKINNIQKIHDNNTEDVCMMATQKIGTIDLAGTSKNNEDVFIVPQNKSESQSSKKFTFKKKQVILDDSLSTILPPKNDEEDVYMAATQKIAEVDSELFKQPTSKLNTIKDSQDDFYLQPTQCLNVNTQPSNLNTSLDENDDVFLMPTQKIQTDTQKIDDFDAGVFKRPFSRSNKNKNNEDDIYLQSTQPLNVNDKPSTSNLPTVDEDDVFIMHTQQLEISSDSSKKLNKIDDDTDDPYFQCTQKIVLNDAYDLETQCILPDNNENDSQKELQCLTDQAAKTSGNRPENPVAHTLAEKNSDDTNTTEHIKDAAKVTFQIPGGPVSKRSNKHVEIKTDLEDRPETLSQIETFINQSSINKVSKIEVTQKKVNQPKKKLETKDEEEDRPETLSQIVAFIKEPLEVNDRRSNRTNKQNKVEETKVKKQDGNTSENNNKGKRLSKRRLSKQEDENLNIASTILENIPEDNEKHDFEPSPKIRKVRNKESNDENVQLNSSSGKDSKSDADQSFINLLESKNTKVKKTRNSNLGKIQVTTTATGRKSMGIAETSVIELTAKTRKSTRTGKTNPKTVAEIQKDKITSVSSGSEFSDSEAPRKITKKSNTKNKRESTIARDRTEETSTEPSAKRVSRRNSASSTSSDAPKINIRNKRKTRGIIEENSDTSEERNKSPEKPSRRSKKETSTTKQTNDKAEDTTSSGKAIRTSKRTRETEQTDVPQKLSKSSTFSSCEDVNTNTDQSKSSEPATPSRGKRISRVKNVVNVTNEPRASADNFSTPKRGQKSVSAEVLLNSAERAKRKLKPKVVFTMFDNPQLESMIKRMGGSVVDTVDSSTVLVTEHVKRTQKLLTAVGQGKPICAPAWLQACKKENEFLDPWDHILVDKEAEKKWEFSLKESLLRASKQKLLQNYVFQIMVANAGDVLKGSIEACGGKCVTKSPSKNSGCKFVIVASPEHKSKYSKIVKQNPDVKVVESEAIFDGVLRQELRFSRHLLT